MKRKQLLFGVLMLLAPLGVHAQLSAYDEGRPVGWASVDSVTDGSRDENPVVVTTCEQLRSLFVENSTTPLTIYIKGEISVPTQLLMKRMGNVTIYGLPGSALVNNKHTTHSDSTGILALDRCHNIILRNITFKGPGAFDRDANDNLTVSRTRHIWVDHCDFQDGMDGNFDCNKTSDYITVSWCHFHYLIKPWPVLASDKNDDHTNDHRFSNLWGSGDRDSITDRGHLNTTFVNCWWGEGVRTRMPFARFGRIHILNCLYSSSVLSTCFNVRFLSNFYVEKCSFTTERAQNNVYQMASSGHNTANITIRDCYGVADKQDRIGRRPYYTPDYAYHGYDAKLVESVVTNKDNGAGATLEIVEGKPFASHFLKEADTPF